MQSRICSHFVFCLNYSSGLSHSVVSKNVYLNVFFLFLSLKWKHNRVHCKLAVVCVLYPDHITKQIPISVINSDAYIKIPIGNWGEKKTNNGVFWLKSWGFWLFVRKGKGWQNKGCLWPTLTVHSGRFQANNDGISVMKAKSFNIPTLLAFKNCNSKDIGQGEIGIVWVTCSKIYEKRPTH